MPKVYLTAEEKKKAESESQARRDDKLLMSDLRENKKRRGLDYKEIAQRAGVSYVTVCKAFNEPSRLQVSTLRQICFAVGVRLEISSEGG